MGQSHGRRASHPAALQAYIDRSSALPIQPPVLPITVFHIPQFLPVKLSLSSSSSFFILAPFICSLSQVEYIHTVNMEPIQIITFQDFKSAGQTASDEVSDLSPTSSSDSLFDGEVDSSDDTVETINSEPASLQESTKPTSARKKPVSKSEPTSPREKPAGKSLPLLEQTTGFQAPHEVASDDSDAETDPEPRKTYGGKGPAYMNQFAKAHHTYDDDLVDDASEVSDAESEAPE